MDISNAEDRYAAGKRRRRDLGARQKRSTTPARIYRGLMAKSLAINPAVRGGSARPFSLILRRSTLRGVRLSKHAARAMLAGEVYRS